MLESAVSEACMGTHLSTFSLAASIRQSLPRALGGSRQRHSSHLNRWGRRNTPGSGVSSTSDEQPLLDVTGTKDNLINMMLIYPVVLS